MANYNNNFNEKITRMVESGADPIAAYCSMGDRMGDSPTCVIYSINATTPAP